MKYVIAQISGRQLVLKPGEWYDINHIKNGQLGDFIYLRKILLFRQADQIQLGTPFLKESIIPVKLIQEVKGKKVLVLKTKPKKKYTRIKGHRSKYTRIQIDQLNY